MEKSTLSQAAQDKLTQWSKAAGIMREQYAKELAEILLNESQAPEPTPSQHYSPQDEGRDDFYQSIRESA